MSASGPPLTVLTDPVGPLLVWPAGTRQLTATDILRILYVCIPRLRGTKSARQMFDAGSAARPTNRVSAPREVGLPKLRTRIATVRFARLTGSALTVPLCR